MAVRKFWLGFRRCGLQYPGSYCAAKLWWKSGQQHIPPSTIQDLYNIHLLLFGFNSRAGNSLFCSCNSLLKERQDRIALYLKSNSRMSLFIKVRQEQNERSALFTFSNTRTICSLRKSDSFFLTLGKLKTGHKKLNHTFWLRF